MRIRPAREDDAGGIASINVRAWREAYRGLIDQDYLDSLSVEEREPQWAAWMRDRPSGVRIWVAEEDGAVVGYISLGPSRDEGEAPDTGELYAIYLEPSLIGTGRGRLLLKHAVRDSAIGGLRARRALDVPGERPGCARVPAGGLAAGREREGRALRRRPGPGGALHHRPLSDEGCSGLREVPTDLLVGHLVAADPEGMVASLDRVQRHPIAQPSAHGFEQIPPGERIARALKEEHRNPDPIEVLVAKTLRLSG
jgi:L-amino acid N-acyltransferase YncA